MKTYTAASHHEVAYRWQIEAPEHLTIDDIESMQKALVDWTDTPDNDALQKMLDDVQYCQLNDVDINKIASFRKCMVCVESCHRETFTQDLQLVKE